MTIRRINFYGGPGSGKSTAAHYTTAKFKKRGYRAEMAREFVKHWTYHHRVPTAWDQVHIFGQQIQEESILLENGIDFAIVECPLVVGAWYTNSLNPELTPHLLSLARKFDEAFPAINIFLDRGELEFDSVGRFSVHDEQSLAEMDRSMYSFVSDYVGTENLHILTSPFNPWELDQLLAKVLVQNAGTR
jgi:nicotinamide riboside kinase